MRKNQPKRRVKVAAGAVAVAVAATGTFLSLSPVEAAPTVSLNGSLTVANPSSVAGVYQGTGTVRITGTLSPGDSDRDGVGDRVRVWTQRGSGEWTQAGTATADASSGRFASVTTVPGTPGAYTYAITNGADPNTAAASQVLSTTTVRASSITLKGWGNKCIKRDAVPIRGSVKPGVANRQVRVERRLGTDGTWKTVSPATVLTSAKGTWSTSIGAWKKAKRRIYIRSWLWEPATNKWVKSTNEWFKRCN